jgi:hypothetical protein
MKKTVVFSVVGLLFFAAVFSLAQRGPGDLPDLVVGKVDFQKVKSGTDAGGHTYWIFNVIITMKNQGKGNAGAFSVLLERNNGAGGTYQKACLTCLIAVTGLAAGQELTLEPRQFNNADNAPSTFRATADSGKAVNESNELNNMRAETFIAISPGDTGPYELAKPDLYVPTFEFQAVSTYSQGGKTYVRFDLMAVVKNQGKAKSGACTLAFERAADPKGYYTLAGFESPVPELQPGAQTTVVQTNFVYEVSGLQKYFRANIDPHDVVKESNETNNLINVKAIPGY